MNGKLQDKVAVITGWHLGIGLATRESIRRRGCLCLHSGPEAARRERSVRRHRQGCRPAVLKFDEVTVQHIRRRPSRVVLNMTGEANMLDRAVGSISVHRRCLHGCFQNRDEISARPGCLDARRSATPWNRASDRGLDR